MKLCLTILVVLCTSVALATTDPELDQCRHQCEVQRQYGPKEKQECASKCEDYYREKKERESGRGESEEGGRGGSHSWDENPRRGTASEPEKRLRECQRQCEKQAGQQRSLCRLRCQEEYKRDKGRGGRGDEGNEEKDENPYVFEEQHFTTTAKSEHGRINLLQKFTERSELLQGVENYRLAVLEANPLTFVTPSHWDADTVVYVAKGRGTITIINEDRRESFNVESGDVMRVRAGLQVYLINRDDNEKLYIVTFIKPVNLPGEFEEFVASNIEDRESFYKAFSYEVLESAFRNDRWAIEGIFQQKQQTIVKASKEQIQAMAHHRQEGGRLWSFESQSSGPFNLLREPPIRSNDYGQLFEATSADHREQLGGLFLTVCLANITRGSVMGPYYNSKATKISIVVDGEGHFEMACPHVRDRSRWQVQSSKSYTRISSRLKPGMVFIVPAGHPVSFVASSNSNLRILCFGVNARDNIRVPLAGRNNAVKHWEREAKELAFGVSAKEVDEVFGSQNEEWFFPGIGRQERQGRAVA